MTNFERIASSPEALALHMNSEKGELCEMCIHCAASAKTMNCAAGEACYQGVLAWLNTASVDKAPLVLTMPCAIGDTIWFVDYVHCQECGYADECPTCQFGGQGTPPPRDYDLCPQVVRETEVWDMCFELGGEEPVLFVNEVYGFTLEDLDRICHSREAAEVDLAAVLREKR